MPKLGRNRIAHLCKCAIQPLLPSRPRFQLAGEDSRVRLRSMKVTDVKEAAERQPFRPFAVRLNNGTEYTFNTPRDFGAPKDYHLIFYFGETTSVRIDADSITEIIDS